VQPGFNYVSQKAQWALWHKTAKEYNKYPNASGFSASVIELPCQIHYHGHPGLSLERQLDFGNADDFLRFYVCEYDLICHKFDPNLDWDPGYCGSPLLGNWELMAFEKSHSVFLGAAISLLVKDELEPNAGHWLSFQKRMKEVESEEREMSLNELHERFDQIEISKKRLVTGDNPIFLSENKELKVRLEERARSILDSPIGHYEITFCVVDDDIFTRTSQQLADAYKFLEVPIAKLSTFLAWNPEFRD